VDGKEKGQAMKAFVKFIQTLVTSRWHGVLHIKFFDGKIAHIDKDDSIDVKPFSEGWE
jgi:hypothetical protein